MSSGSRTRAVRSCSARWSGVARADGILDLRYQHVSTTHEIRTGRCRSTPELLEDGRIRLHEQWEWTEGGTGAGSSVVEQVKPAS